MSIDRRQGNVLFVSFNTRPPADACAECPFRRCCTCAHWCAEERACVFERQPDIGAPVTDEDDWCGRWEARELRVVNTQP